MLGVVESGDVAAGLVEHEVAVWLGAAEELAVDADVVLGGVVTGAEGGDGGSVDLNAAFEDDLFGLAAGGYAGLGEDLLETVALRGFFGGSGSEVLRHDVGFLTAEGLIAVGEELCSIIAAGRALLLSVGYPPRGWILLKYLFAMI